MTALSLPAWQHTDQARTDAVHKRLPLALEELALLYRARLLDPTDCIGEGRLIDVTVMEQALLHENAEWTRHVRRSKKGEKERLCYKPSDDLARLQSNLVYIVFPYDVPIHTNPPWFPATAYGEGCSVVANAKHHQHGRSSFRVDVKNAFPSVTANHIASYLVKSGCGKNLAWVAARLFTFHGRIEQGAHIAPMLFNVMLRKLDEALGKATGADVEDARIGSHLIIRGKDNGFSPQWIGARFVNALPGDCRFPAACRPVVYTRYGDDCCFSYRGDEFPKELELVITATIESCGFTINRKKTRRAKDGCVDLPGAFIREGRIRPTGAYVRKLKKLVADKTLTICGKRMEGNVRHAFKQRAGHISFIAQFGHSGRLRVFKNIGGLRFDAGRTRQERERKRAHLARLREEKERGAKTACNETIDEGYL